MGDGWRNHGLLFAPIIDGLLKRLPKLVTFGLRQDRKLWLQLLEGSFKLIYRDKATSVPPPGKCMAQRTAELHRRANANEDDRYEVDRQRRRSNERGRQLRQPDQMDQRHPNMWTIGTPIRTKMIAATKTHTTIHGQVMRHPLRVRPAARMGAPPREHSVELLRD
jgi:hypothetical protein